MWKGVPAPLAVEMTSTLFPAERAVTAEASKIDWAYSWNANSSRMSNWQLRERAARSVAACGKMRLPLANSNVAVFWGSARGVWLLRGHFRLPAPWSLWRYARLWVPLRAAQSALAQRMGLRRGGCAAPWAGCGHLPWSRAP